MTSRIVRLARAGALSSVLALAACQSYEPRPLDLANHASTWSARTPSDDSVHAFLDRLEAENHPDAASFDPADGLSLTEAKLVALVYNPELRLARLRAGVAAATAAHAGRWDDPELSIDVLRITQSVANPWVVSPGLAITIPISGRLKVEKARANAQTRALLDGVAEEEWRIAHDVTTTWLEWTAARRRLDEQARLIESVESLARATSAFAEAGEMLPTEAALFRIEHHQRMSERVQLESSLEQRRLEIHSLLGLSADAPLDLVPDDSPPADRMKGDSIEITDQNLTLARLAQEYEVAEQTLRREIRKQYPDLTIGPLYESDEGQSRVGFLGAIPIPILNANRQGIAQAEAARELARAAYETEYERLTTIARRTYSRRSALALERSMLEREEAPLVDRQLADARRLVELGEGGALVLLESLVRAHSTKLRLIDVRLAEAQEFAALDHLAGPDRPQPTEPSSESSQEDTP